MLSTLLSLLSLTLLTIASSVTVHNTKPWPLCLHVESSMGWFPTTTTCSGFPGASVPAYQTNTFNPSGNWNGALTPITNGLWGTRFEINFAATPGHTWYDADMELGLSASTLGPSDHRQRMNNQERLSSLAGEQDPLAKANAAWLRSPSRWELLHYPKYVVADKGERLVWVYNDKQAPQVVQQFLQLEADFQAYCGPGSVAGQGMLSGVAERLREAQDKKTWYVDTQDMTITIY
ncbi:MAG: hypothetical protein Q9170_005159 [Blastenia crenularia]